MKNRILDNALWIIIMQCIKALITLGVSMLTTRLLGPSNYGLINYAASIVSFVAPIVYLGYNNILVRELVQQPQKEGEILGTAIGSSLFSGIICVGAVIGFVSIVNAGERETLLVCSLYSVLLIFQSIDLILYWFQAKLMSKYSAIASLFAYVMVAGYKVLILFFQKDVYWFAISSAIEYMLLSIVLFIIYKQLGGQKLKFSLTRMKRMLSTSRYYIIAAIMVSISAYIDRIMIKLMISDTANGYYSAAATCAAMMTFVFVAIIDSFRPEIVDSKKKNEEKYRNMMKMLYSTIIYLSIIQCVVFSCLADWIVQIICGESYAHSVLLLRIMVWYTPFSYLATARNVWILAEHNEKYLWIISLSSASISIAMNLILIPAWGTIGAAVTSLVSNLSSVVIMTYLIKPIRESLEIMVQSLNPKVFVNAIKSIIDRAQIKG